MAVITPSNAIHLRAPHKFLWAPHRCLPSISFLNLFPHAQSFMIRFVCTSKVCRQRLSGNNLDPHSSPVSFLTHRQVRGSLALDRPPWWNFTWSLTDCASCWIRVLHPVQPHPITATSSGSGRLSRGCLRARDAVRCETRGAGIGFGFFARPL